ncbi:MAG: hypothetical protein OEM05_06055 [Myxococcales bacterium]|nr:hypothetical protein [Myxococcales bacterium]
MKAAHLVWTLWALVACNTTYGPGAPPEPGPVEATVCAEGSTEPACAMENPVCTDPSDDECMGSM